MKTYKNIVFDPSYVGSPGDDLNMFQGFKAQLLSTYDLEKIKPILYHLKEVLNNGDEDNYNWMIKHLAHIVQKPYIKTGNAIVNWGEKGAGKNALWEWFGTSIIGEKHYVYLNNINDLTGQFTSLFAFGIFVILDEAVFSGGHLVHNMLKSLITQMTQKLEKKGVDPILIKNYMNLFFLSNNPDPVKIEGSNCRRYDVKEVSDKHVKDHVYFDALNQDTANHFYTFLMEQDISKYRTGCAPMTTDKMDMAVYSMKPIEVFVEELLEGEIIYKKTSWNINEKIKIPDQYFEAGERYEITMKELWDFYNTFLDSKSAGDRIERKTKLSFSKEIRRLLKIENVSKDRHNGCPIFLTIEKKID